MRPAGRSELESLYFRYPDFRAPPASAVEGAGRHHGVVIIGGGPVGVAAALALASHGTASVLVERKNTYNDGSRAICLSRSSMYVLERLGAVAPFVEKALGWTVGRCYFRGMEVGQFEMPHDADDKYLPMYNIEQQYIEQYLHRAAERSGLIDIRWQTEVLSVAQDGDGAELQLRSPEGDYRLTADYLLAADGARSPTRERLGLRLRGENLEGRYVIADIRAELGFPTERRALFEPRSNPGGTVLIHRQPDDIWRVDYQLAAGEDEHAAVAEENIRARVGAILDELGYSGCWELEWWSVYSANTLCLDDYRHGRIFFVGDSAHIVPIFGVRGLNNGLQDAENIGWKLSRVLSGRASEVLLDSYTPERRGATLDVFANAGKSAAFMTPPTSGHALFREAALSFSLTEDFARPLTNPRQMTPFRYEPNALTIPDRDDFASGPQAGAVLSDIRLGNGDFLLDRMGRGYTLLLFSADDGLASGLLDIGRKHDSHFEVLSIGNDAAADIIDVDGRIAARFGAWDGTAYLLRPDQYVAARWRSPSVTDIAGYFQAFGAKA